MRFEFFVAARYLRAKRRQAVVGVITVISIAGVAVGVASLIIALAITNGMRRDLQDRLLSSTAHVELMRVQNDGIRDWRALTERLRRVPRVTAAAPGLYEAVLLSLIVVGVVVYAGSILLLFGKDWVRSLVRS